MKQLGLAQQNYADLYHQFTLATSNLAGPCACGNSSILFCNPQGSNPNLANGDPNSHVWSEMLLPYVEGCTVYP